MFGIAIAAITDAAAKLVPDIAPKIPHAKTVAIASHLEFAIARKMRHQKVLS
jgi:hypothetical protein